MNAARLTRRWQEAAGDPARMVEALVDEIDDRPSGSSRASGPNAARMVRSLRRSWRSDPARMAEILPTS